MLYFFITLRSLKQIKQYKGDKMKGFILGVSIVSCILYLVFRFVADIHFEQNCEGHLKRAADANTIELATQEMKFAVAYLEKEGLTQGYTSVLYKTPDEDIGFWYSNLKASLQELESINPKTATPLERSNVLMKLRETLLDQGEKTDVTFPAAIYLYPNNGIYSFWIILTLIFLVGSAAAMGLFED